MSQVVSMRLQEDQLVRLQRYARTLGKTPSEVSAMLVEEQLREQEFAFIEFRPSPVGRQAYMKGSRLTVWWLVYVAKSYGMNAEELASHFKRPPAWVNAAINYYAAFPKQIDQAIDDHRGTEFDTLKRALPNATTLELSLGEIE